MTREYESMQASALSTPSGGGETWFQEQSRQRTRLVYLAVMRIVVGYHFLTLAWPKFTAGIDSVPLRLWINPDAPWFGSLVAYSELAVGVSLAAGLLVRVWGTLGTLLTLNVYLAGGNNAVLGFNRMLFVLLVAFVLASAGRSLGVDGWLHRKFPGNRMF